MKLLYHGPMWEGSTTLQRLKAFERINDITVLSLDTGARPVRQSLWARIRWKSGWPIDSFHENERIIARVTAERPDAVLVDNSKVIRHSTLDRMRQLGVKSLSYYTPDDIIGPHNLKAQLRRSFQDWDLFFTTKTFNVPELKARGVRNPVLVGNAYDPETHFPASPVEVGEDYENFDLVFMGAYERERCSSINALAEAGLKVVVYGGQIGGWNRIHMAPSIELRDAIFGMGYRRAMHHGKIALGFLRKLNRDRITTRTIEIAAMGRPMLAEKTDEHDKHFIDGSEYVGFTSDTELVDQARVLIHDHSRRRAIGEAARKRCVNDGYSTDARARQMIEAVASSLGASQEFSTPG